MLQVRAVLGYKDLGGIQEQPPHTHTHGSCDVILGASRLKFVGQANRLETQAWIIENGPVIPRYRPLSLHFHRWLGMLALRFQKAIPPFHQSFCFRMMSNMVRPVNPTSMGPLPHFFCCEVSSLIWSNALWNSLTVDSAFCMQMNGSLGRSITCREGKSVPRVHVYSMMEVIQCNQPANLVAGSLPWGMVS